jgi:predicted house-cleaning noncanonical NTP pyrophosphatase (MazG superfamily)
VRPRLVKLVRDRIGEFLGDSTVSYEPITDRDDPIGSLRLKLIEEAVEYLRDPCIGELADVLAVVEALADADLGCGFQAVDREAEAKYHERGGFGDLMGMYVHTTAPARHEAA